MTDAVSTDAMPGSAPRQAARVRRHAPGTSRLISVLYSTGLALTAFGAVYKPAALGYLAASPGILLIVVSLLLLPTAAGTLRSPESRHASWLLAYGIVAAAFTTVILGPGALHPGKILPLLILSSVWLSPLLCADHLRSADVRAGLVAALAICAIGYLFGDVFRGSIPAGVNGIIFGGGYEDYVFLRPRAFMQENSHLAVIVGRFLLILFLLREGRRAYSASRLALFMIALTLLLTLLGSKGAALSVLAAVAVVGMTRRLLPFVVLSLPLLWWAASAQVEALTYDLENFTSVSTRATLTLASAAAMASNPFGYGFAGFYGAIQHFGVWSMGWLGDQVPLILTEVTEIVEDLTNVSTKSTLLDFGIIFGIPFLLMMVAMIRRMRTSDPRVRAALIYFVLSAMGTGSHESISFFLGMAVLLHCFPATRARSTAARTRRRPRTAASATPPAPGPVPSLPGVDRGG
jgi:hypothetical protein